MYFADLATETQVDRGAHVRAVGWLTRDHAFTSGDVPREFAIRLRGLCASSDLSADELYWPAAGGFHDCELCGDYSSGGNLGVPAGSLLYVAPETVSHYVDAHAYQPPESFVRAVLECPDFGSDAFKSAVAAFREMNLERARARRSF